MSSKVVPSETQEQIWLFEWAETQVARYPELQLMFHVPNEGKRSVVLGRQMKRMGLKTGVPDVILPVPKGRYHGLAIEMKSLKGKPTAAQLIWIENLRAVGWRAAICHGWKDAADTVWAYLHEEKE